MLSVSRLTVRRGGKTVLQEISLSLAAGRTLAVIGESGAGKSTLVAAVLGLLPLSGGTVLWEGRPLPRGAASLVMQEPRAAFNPALSLRRSVLEPVRRRPAAETNDRIGRLCAGLDLDPALLSRRPNQVSIGQAQRVGILRALIAAPPLVVFDEPLSALDAVTQKTTATLMSRLRKEEGFASLIVTHDLGFAAAHADGIVILRNGVLVERADAADFFRAPATDYGRALRNAALSLGALGRAA